MLLSALSLIGSVALLFLMEKVGYRGPIIGILLLGGSVACILLFLLGLFQVVTGADIVKRMIDVVGGGNQVSFIGVCALAGFVISVIIHSCSGAK